MENEIKPMTKKELIKRIEEYKPKYIYQRYNGEIRQFEVVDNNYLVETKTGMSIDFRSHLMLGKVSEKLINLIEIGDLVLYKCINLGGKFADKLHLDIIEHEVDLQDYKNRFNDNFWKLVSFITKEELNKFMNNLED